MTEPTVKNSNELHNWGYSFKASQGFWPNSQPKSEEAQLWLHHIFAKQAFLDAYRLTLLKMNFPPFRAQSHVCCKLELQIEILK